MRKAGRTPTKFSLGKSKQKSEPPNRKLPVGELRLYVEVEGSRLVGATNEEDPIREAEAKLQTEGRET